MRVQRPRPALEKWPPRTVPLDYGQGVLEGQDASHNGRRADRPHWQFKGKAPGDVTPCEALPANFWDEPVDTDRMPSQKGVVEAVRMVLSDGRGDTWGQQIRLSSILAGQYGRLRFLVGDGCDTGVVIWQPKRNVDIPVAQFHHTMDNRSFRGLWPQSSTPRL